VKRSILGEASGTDLINLALHLVQELGGVKEGKGKNKEKKLETYLHGNYINRLKMDVQMLFKERKYNNNRAMSSLEY
jgi:hypothetical protein